jgi:hypothetical protein
MNDQIPRRRLIKAAAGIAVAGSAGCMSSKDSDSTSTPTENTDGVIRAEEMGEWMEKNPDYTWAELAQNSAQLNVKKYNSDMQNSGTHIDTAAERSPVDNPIVNEESAELTFTEIDSEAPAERLKAELRLKTDSESVYGNFENFEDYEDLFNQSIGQLFGAVMQPTVGTLFTDSIGPDYRESQADPDSKAIEGIEYVLEDNAGNEETLQYNSNGVDELSKTYDEVINQEEEFYESALKRLDES